MHNLDPLLLFVLDRLPDLFVIFDEQEQVLFINESGRNAFGLGADEDISKLRFADLIASEARAVFKNEVIAKLFLTNAARQVSPAKSLSTGEVFDVEFDLFSVTKNLAAKGIFMALGKDLRVHASEMKRLSVFEAVIENSPDFVGIADKDMKPFYLNPAGRKLLGIDLQKDISAVKIEDCYPEELRDFVKSAILTGMNRDGHWSGETYFQHFATKEKIPVHDKHFLLKDRETGVVLGHATITRDMSHEKRMQSAIEDEKEKMIQASKLATLGEMAAGIAHEINNPLSIIAGARVALGKSISDPGLLRKLEMIEKSTDRIFRIVMGLKKFGRSSIGINKSVFSFQDLVEDCFHLLSSKAQQFHVKLVHEPKVDFELYADEIQVEQTIVNLVSNAIDANSNKEGSWVRVLAENDGDCLRIIVQDSGRGIREEIVEKLFNPFFTTKPPGKGTGLGLSIAKGIAKDHGGDLTYEVLDGHTAFVLRIPNREA